MITVATIVAGYGEVWSLPILIGRMASRVAPSFQLRIVRLVRTHGQRIVLLRRLENALETAVRKTGRDGRIMILLDSDGD